MKPPRVISQNVMRLEYMNLSCLFAYLGSLFFLSPASSLTLLVRLAHKLSSSAIVSPFIATSRWIDKTMGGGAPAIQWWWRGDIMPTEQGFRGLFNRQEDKRLERTWSPFIFLKGT